MQPPGIESIYRLDAMTKMRCHLYHSLRLARDERWASGYRRDIAGDRATSKALSTLQDGGSEETHIAQIIDLGRHRHASS